MEKILNIICAIIFVCYGVLDCFGLFDNVSFLENKSNSLMLIAMSIFLFTNLREKNIILKEISEKTNKMLDVITILSSHKTIETVDLNSSEELFNYLSTALSKSQKSVYELTWGETSSTLKTNLEKVAFKNYFNTLLDLIQKTEIDYKEVMTFPSKKRVHRVNRIITNGYKGYKLRYYNISPQEHKLMPPLMQFTIIDEKEVILHIYGDGSNAKYIAIKNSKIVNYFVDYYNSIWLKADIIIDIDYINHTIVNELNSMIDDSDIIESKLYEKIYCKV